MKSTTAKLPAALLAELVERGWSVKKLATESGVSLSVVQDLCSGSRPRLDTLERILSALGLSWAWLDSI
jgi:transcriptional regulator with XRE-family HTH domain